MFDLHKVAYHPTMFFVSAKNIVLVIVLTFTLAACGGLGDFNGVGQTSGDVTLSDPSPSDPSPTFTTITWDPITVDGEDAQAYRVLYSRSGERPEQVLTTSNQANLDTSSLQGYTVYVEAYDSSLNSVFEKDNYQVLP